ncbi:MAG: alpha/beta fold hydrolase [Sphingomonadales bacterium]|nr:MAG: alpha/beta fold hydrolase [Sphingomonadales bacterium]
MRLDSHRIEFPGSQGILAARLDTPRGGARAYALFAHCFTCSKDIFAASRIAARLADNGIATLRFDFTGLGASEGEFANTNFSSNVDDLVAAADWLATRHGPAQLMVGHSLGGAAVLAAAERVPGCRAVATIGAPYDPAHVTHQFHESMHLIEADGEAQVTLAGRQFRIRRQFIDDVFGQPQAQRIASLKRALLVLHAPLDDTVSVDNASAIFGTAKHPKSFVSLDTADHLLRGKADAMYAADVIAAWALRYLNLSPETAPPQTEPGETIVQESGLGRYAQAIRSDGHLLTADEPESVGGDDLGPDPYDLLLSSLGACTSMTMRMYAQRKGLRLEQASVRLRHRKIHASDCTDCETKEGLVDEMTREITLVGDLSADERAKLLEIADKCPVHRTLHSEVRVTTRLID